MPRLGQLHHLVRLLIADRQRLVLENAALRHQLVVLERSVSRPKITDSERVFWIMLHRTLKDWRAARMRVNSGRLTSSRVRARSSPSRPSGGSPLDAVHVLLLFGAHLLG